MDTEVLERIKMIRQGKVPEGYKRTKAGIMPEEWLISGKFVKAKSVFYSVSSKNNSRELEVLSATQEQGVIPRSELDIDIKYNETSLDGYKKVDKGDFVISLRSFQGGIEYSEYTGLVSPAYTVLKPKVDICAGYYKPYFKTDDYIKRLNKATYGIRDGKQISYDDFGEMIIHFPPLEEQKRIADILSTQDQLIESCEKKLARLKELKKAMLQKMFPAKGERVPEVRFPGFTGAWEQRSVSSIGNIVTGSTPRTSVSEYYGGGLLFISPADIQENRYVDETITTLTRSGFDQGRRISITVSN